MSEYSQGWLGSLALIPSIVFSTISWLGGRPNGRILKRLVAPIIFCGLTIALSALSSKFTWWFFLSIPAYLVQSTIGYGGDTLWQKITRRSIWSLTRSMCALTFVLFSGAWVLFIAQTVIGLIMTLVLGLTNVLPAPQEENLINFSSVFVVPFMVL